MLELAVHNIQVDKTLALDIVAGTFLAWVRNLDT